MFYASWCGYCKKALPLIDAMAKEYADKPVRFAAVSLDTLVEDGVDPQKNKRAKTRDYVVNQFKNMGISSVNQAFDPAKAGKTKYKATSFPTMFLTDKTGKIAKVYIGGKAVNDGTLKKDIEALLGT